MWRTIGIIWVILLPLIMTAQRKNAEKQQQAWTDSVYQSLSPQERIAQLFMVAAYSNKDKAHEDAVAQLVEDHQVGGLIFFQGSPAKQARMTNRFQALAKVPLLIAIDGEWGLAMRLDSTIKYPKQLTLGAIQDNELIHEMGADIGKQMRRMGVHVNFAPVIDINNNPQNPVINYRSFGEDKLNVALKGLAYSEGMQQEGIIACAKHFPGHGDTDKDSHKTLPTIPHSMNQLQDMELYPFKILFNNGVKSVMAAHLNVPAIDNTPGMATSLSSKALKDLLREEMGFEGLVFSDALNMKGVSKDYGPNEVALKAFQAGNDVLLFAEDVPNTIKLFEKALDEGTITWQQIEESVKKILNAKYEVGLGLYRPVETRQLTEDLNKPEYTYTNRKLYEEALTLAANEGELIPFKRLDTLQMAALNIGLTGDNMFRTTLNKYAPFHNFDIEKDATAADFSSLADQLKLYDAVVVGLHDMSYFASKDYGVTQNTLNFLKQLNRETKVVVVVFGSPYSLKYFDFIDWLLVANEDNTITHELAPQALFGGLQTKGRMPVTASVKYPYGHGLETTTPFRLKYSVPEEVGLSTASLKKIDSLANAAIEDEATPGCQILVAKEGKVIYQKSFGHHTYDADARPVRNDDLYDLASITKVAATTLSLMYLSDLRLFQVNRRLSEYLPELDTTNKKNLVARDVLIHKAGLKSWIPFYANTLVDTIYQEYYCSESNGYYSIEVADNMYIACTYEDSMFCRIFYSPVKQKPKYKYSDLGFYLFRDLIERLTDQPMEDFVYKQFYRRLGLSTMTYLPLEKFPKERVVPTELDTVFRQQLIHGYVHDPGAAMMGGVSGHAGLFSDANDLAILFQMLLNRGDYGGDRYIKPTTITMFTRKQVEGSRRGLGFDKPELEKDIGPTAESASPKAFGHSGFTGTCVWADPEYDLVYVFLSNRVHPTAENTKLITNNVRTDIMQVIYDAILAEENLTTDTAKKN